MEDAVRVERGLDEVRLQQLGVRNWPVWEKEPSRFPWHYDVSETCYLLSGRVTVYPDHGEPVELVAGNLVTFAAGLSCEWQIHEPLRKHYCFA
ncbi:cupin domain-containing protein [Chitinilyticum piscinae]|uniref:Cupin domain-containing protein n=1 Tax=Chitinilyticum piscinae TaxID=2866724 RepID=A0A8J7FQ20_9NEIS|nr:cupin domain-containing protein [Chitinilyticum piscinae]MBE9610139.1 cupin domain-containing protein [Chitinilyticum piscinae]